MERKNSTSPSMQTTSNTTSKVLALALAGSGTPSLDSTTPLGTPPQSRTPPPPPNAALLPCSPSSTISTSSTSSTTFTAPSLPAMPARELPHFRRGAIIALENIAGDYLGNTDMSLLEVVQDLEDTRPIIGGQRYDSERRSVLDGGTYVYEAMRGLWAQAVGERSAHEDGSGQSDHGSHEAEEVFAGVEKESHALQSASDAYRANGLEPEAVYDEVESDNFPTTAAPDALSRTNNLDLSHAEFEIRDADGDSRASADAQDKFTDEDEYERTEEEVQVVLNLLRILAQWIDEQTCSALKAGQMNRFRTAVFVANCENESP